MSFFPRPARQFAPILILASSFCVTHPLHAAAGADAYTPEALKALSRQIVVSNDSSSLGKLAVPDNAGLPLAHKNKYGKDYPPVANDATYPGAPKQ